MIQQNLKLTLAYEGTHYFGWQKTRKGPSIESALEHALERILQEKIVLQAASRTDRGVHAEGQVINFFITKKFDLKKLQKSLNALLPKDIRIIEIEEVHKAFHPTLDAIKKEYHYFIEHGSFQSPFKRHFTWHCPYFLDIERMKKASTYFLGRHDFSAFSNVKSPPHRDKVRSLFSLEIIISSSNEMRIEIIGDHFLYKMVRNLVGTLVYVGCGKIHLSEIPSILESKDRRKAGMTAPAQGLFLKKIIY